jgi:hypothetical protein
MSGKSVKSSRAENSEEPSPMGSSIFIVKSESKKSSQSPTDPFRHEPVTQQNIGRTILRGVRCETFNCCFFCLSFSKFFQHFGQHDKRKKIFEKIKNYTLKQQFEN